MDDDVLLTIGNPDGMIGPVPGSLLEICPQVSSMSAIERPERTIPDFDPGEEMARADAS
jgi:hypothetical protein